MLRKEDDKTECIVLKSKYYVNTFAEQNVQIDDTKVRISHKKNIGVTFVQTLSMKAHVNTIAQKMFLLFEKHVVW